MMGNRVLIFLVRFGNDTPVHIHICLGKLVVGVQGHNEMVMG